MQELSQWFNLSDQKPWQPGVYKTQDNHGEEYYNYFDGEEFHWGSAYIEKTRPNEPIKSHATWTVNWRGLSSDPSKPSPSPKPSGNRRVTRYVVMDFALPCAVFEKKADADRWVKAMGYGSVETIRFRTPEASQA